MYPVSQVFQMDEDRERNYQTFAIQYGLKSVKNFYLISFVSGIMTTGFALRWVEPVAGELFLGISAVTGLLIWWQVHKISGREEDFQRVMRMKYFTSFAFVAYIISWLIIMNK